MPLMLRAFTLYNLVPIEFVVVGDKESEQAKSALQLIHSRRLIPHKVVLFADDVGGQEFLTHRNEFLRNIQPSKDLRVMICQNLSCKMPIEASKDPEWKQLEQEIERI